MNPIRMAAVATVTAALILYTVGTVLVQRSRRSTPAARGWLTCGLAFDTIATALMVIAVGRFAITLHGVLGWSALAFMAVDVTRLWRHASEHGTAPLTAGLHRYSLVAYLYWVVAYFTGAALVMMAKRGGGA